MTTSTLVREPTSGAGPGWPVPGESGGIRFDRLLRAELRKMLDTRAGRWLLVGIALLSVGASTILQLTDGGRHPFSDYLQAAALPTALVLPVVGILAVTSEWSQRTALVTFTLEPRRARVAVAKTVAAALVGLVAVAGSLLLAFAAYGIAIGPRGLPGTWDIPGGELVGASAFIMLGLLHGVGLGMLLRHSAATVVVYYALPTVWGIASQFSSVVERAGAWADLNRTIEPLFTGSLTGEQWAHLATATGLWVVLPLVVGTWLVTRSEVK